VEYSQ